MSPTQHSIRYRACFVATLLQHCAARATHKRHTLYVVASTSTAVQQRSNKGAAVDGCELRPIIPTLQHVYAQTHVCCTIALSRLYPYSVRVLHCGMGSSSAQDRRAYGHTPAEQSVVQLILKLHDRGYSLRRIAKQLNAWGCPPRTARAWTPMYVERVLDRELTVPNGNVSIAQFTLESYPRCAWCAAGSELSNGKPTCVRCGHRLDVPKFRCDCASCTSTAS